MTEFHVPEFSGALVSKGFDLMASGKRTSVRMRLNHGEHRVDEWLPSQIARELHLSKRVTTGFSF